MTHLAALVPDLIDRSRIEAAVTAAGASIEFVNGAAELAAAASRAQLVILDLEAPGVLEALAGLGGVRTIGFASHVERDLLAAARAAGCDEVLARSAMFRRLPALVAPGP